jgi:hypothetical protein
MLQVIGALIGLAGAFLPELFKLKKSKQDQKHELEMAKLQIEAQKETSAQQLQAIEASGAATADVGAYAFAPVVEPKTEGKWWAVLLTNLVYAYNSTVRPTVTYLLLFAYLFVKKAQVKLAMAAGGDLYQAIVRVWTETDASFVSMIIVFWFGGRQILRANNRLK